MKDKIITLNKFNRSTCPYSSCCEGCVKVQTVSVGLDFPAVEGRGAVEERDVCNPNIRSAENFRREDNCVKSQQQCRDHEVGGHMRKFD